MIISGSVDSNTTCDELVYNAAPMTEPTAVAASNIRGRLDRSDLAELIMLGEENMNENAPGK